MQRPQKHSEVEGHNGKDQDPDSFGRELGSLPAPQDSEKILFSKIRNSMKNNQIKGAHDGSGKQG